MPFWPDKPENYREVMGRYATEEKKLSSRILELVCAGMLDLGYLGGDKSQNYMLYIHNYPPCPDPSLTLGLSTHGDPTLLTLAQQRDVSGLQVLKDHQGLGVDLIPHTQQVYDRVILLFFLGHFLRSTESDYERVQQEQVISNNKLRSVEHRPVTNSEMARTSIVSFINPTKESIIEPAKSLINKDNPPLCKAFQFKDFFKTYLAKSADKIKTVDE